MARIYIGLICLFLIACSSKKSGGGDGGSGGETTEETNDEETTEVDAEVSVTESTVVNLTSSNIASYTLSGTCNINGQPVTVKFGNATPTTQPTCTDKAWTATWDLTGYDLGAAVTIVIEHKEADDSSTDQVSKAITNSFSCGTGYVPVPPLTGYTDKAFCVMKYEAKEGTGSVPESVATGKPWVSINYTDAKSKCTGLGTGYDLITNDEWQTIARNAELVATNWSGGTVGSSGGMNTGHTDGTPVNHQAASTDDTDPCVNTGQTCSDTTWDSQRRTHKLSNGRVIWDLGGNASELVKDLFDISNQNDFGSDANISTITETSHSTNTTLTAGSVTRTRKTKGHFGPSGDYTSLSTEPYGHLGRFSGDSAFSPSDALNGTIQRGSPFTASNGGIFNAFIALSLTYTSTSLGFRCVHNPT